MCRACQLACIHPNALVCAPAMQPNLWMTDATALELDTATWATAIACSTMLASMPSTLFIAFVNHHCVHKSSHNKVYQLTFPAALCLSSLQGSIACRYKQHSSTKLKQNGKLHHSQKGALSVSLSGAEFAITFGKAITLDSSHQESPGCAVIAPAHMLYLLECACVIYRCCCCSGLQSSQSAIVVAAAVTAACGTFTAQPPLDILHTGRSVLQQQAGCAGHKLIDSESYAQDGSCHHHPELAVIRFCLRHMCSVKQLLLHATGGR